MTDIIKSPKATIMLDASQFDLFHLCPARYNYRYVMRKTLPLIQKNRSLDIGSLAHEGFEVYYRGIAEGVHFLERIANVALRIRSKAANPDESNIQTEEAEGLINVITENLDYWRHEDETLVIKFVEEPFAYVLYEDEDIRIIMTGKIDLLVDKPSLGHSASYFNLPIDHKTYSRDSQLSRLSNQFINYACAVESNYLIVNRVGLQKTLKPEEKYKRIPLSYDPMIIKQWKDNVIRILLEDYATCVATKSWPMNFTSCLKFNRMCEYFEVCDSSGEDAKQWKLENSYVEADPWDVTKKLEEEI